MHWALVACAAMGLAAGLMARVLALALLSVAVAISAAVTFVLLGSQFVPALLASLALLAVLQAWYLVGAGLHLITIRIMPRRWLPQRLGVGLRTEEKPHGYRAHP